MTGPNVRDTALKQTAALPNGAATTQITGIDLGLSAFSDFVADVEWLLTIPALGATPLADAKTIIYKLECDDNSSFSSAKNLGTLYTQTGAGGVGHAGDTFRFRLPSNVEKYFRVKATGSTTGDASGSSFTVEALF